MPGNGNVLIIVNPTLSALGIDVYDSLGERTRAGHGIVIRGVDSASFHDCRRVTKSVDEMQRLHESEECDEAVERLVARSPDVTMTPAQEEAG